MADPQLPATLLAMNQALRSGDIAALAPLWHDLERTSRDVQSQTPAEMAGLTAMRQLAAENQVLLEAVGRGLRQAANRLAEIKEARRGLRTYGPGGASRSWVDQTGQGRRF